MVRSTLLWGVVGMLLLPAAVAEAPQQITLQLRWLHQFQFAGYYMAKEQGYYREAGLEVEFRERPVERSEVEVLLAGEADYAVSGSNILLDRANGAPLVALAAISQQSPLALLVRGDSAIREPADLRGKRIMVRAEDATIFAMLRAAGLPPEEYQRVAPSFNHYDLIDDKVDAMIAYTTNEGFLLQELGIPYRYLKPADYGIDTYGDILITTEQEVAQHRERVERMRDASLKGWQYAFDYPDETIALIRERYNSQNKSREALEYEARALRQLVQPERVALGQMRPAQWEMIRQHYLQQGMLSGVEDVTRLLYQPQGFWPTLTPQQQRELRLIVVGALLLAASVLATILLWSRRLQQKELEYRTLFEASPDGVLLLEPPSWCFVMANPAARRMFGLPADGEMGSYTPVDLSPAQQPTGESSALLAERRIEEALEQGEVRFEWLHMDRGGVQFLSSVRLTRIDLHKRTLLQATIRNISNERAMQREIEQSREETERILETLQDGVALLDASGTILRTNKALQLLLQVGNTPLQGRPFSPLLKLQSNDSLQSESTGVNAGEGGDCQLRSSSGELIPVSLRRSEIILGDGSQGEVVVLHDLRHRLMQEQVRMDVTNQLAYQSGLAEVTANVLHNIGNVITGISGRSEQISEAVEDLQAVQRSLQRATEIKQLAVLQQGVGKTAALLAEMLESELQPASHAIRTGVDHVAEVIMVQQEMARGNHQLSVRFSIRKALEDVRALYQSSLDRRQITLQFEISPEVDQLLLPKNPFMQVVSNLIKNSREAIDERRQQHGEMGLMAGEIRLQVNPYPEGQFQLRLSDNGIGIAAERIPQLFQRGVTSKATGSGFGLHSIATFANSIGGSVRVESEGINRGATLLLTLPLEVEQDPGS